MYVRVTTRVSFACARKRRVRRVRVKTTRQALPCLVKVKSIRALVLSLELTLTCCGAMRVQSSVRIQILYKTNDYKHTRI